MPWKGETDPYKIWISEIILQQTRVEQGLDYYNRFVKTFPTVVNLARAKEENVFKLWEGLGYYSRCRNLLHAAKTIMNDLNGQFPKNYDAILSLKGVGPYTAAAIASFAFNLPYAVVDGNVMRVLARFTGKKYSIDSTEGKKYFNSLAQEWLDKTQPGKYNQAIMDFGATVCKPASPLCSECPFNKTCYAYRNNKIESLPVRTKKISIRKRRFAYLVIKQNKKWAVHQRVQKDIWAGLYQFPHIETKSLNNLQKTAPFKHYEILSVSPVYKQQLSHQLIEARFIEIELNDKVSPGNEWRWMASKQLDRLAFPRIVRRYLENSE
jgi:A/G-specific adenine glycosylase